MLSLLIPHLFLQGLCIFFLWQHRRLWNAQIKGFMAYIRKYCTESIPCPMTNEIQWLQYLVQSLRAGRALHETLESYGKEPIATQREQALCQEIVRGEKVEGHLIGEILSRALTNGNPCAHTLDKIRKSLQLRLSSQRRVDALTIQVRAQAWLASVLPWLVLFLFFLVDKNFIINAFSSIWSCGVLLLAIIFNSIGLWWIKKIQSAVMYPRGMEDEEVYLPKFILAFLSFMESGLDPQTAIQRSLVGIPVDTKVSSLAIHSTQQDRPLLLQQTRMLLKNSIEYGASIRDDMQGIFMEIEEQKKLRWERAAQILPLKLLLPIFLCILPATFFVILFPILPSLLAF